MNLPSAANFDILAHLFEFVKHFFTSFFKFFCAFCRPPSFRFSSDNFDMISQKFRFVKNFFLVFSNFFDFFRRPVGDWHILALPRPFVKHYFTKNALFFCLFYHTDIRHLLLDNPLLISVNASPASYSVSCRTARSPRLTIPQSFPFSTTGSRRI